ncbi:MAG: Ni/Fe-hydrogenase 1 b-type cytochrome subunit [Caulobacteraceae bacterium]|nr:MAG: Ni/Fe-hydrogenase 1 b-type cytochrome subunit [Caulobacteraceae bacterium]
MPTRLFHWLLAALVAFSWWSHEAHLDWHKLSGFAIAGLLVFRLWWGVAGSSTARFAGFLKGPAGVVAYLKGGAAGAPGHNPLGGWSVAAMLLVMVGQVALGLFAINDDFEGGPLTRYVDYDTGLAIGEWHGILFNVLLGLIVLHLLAVGFYAARRQNLIGPMITGRGTVGEGATPPVMAPLWRLLVGLTLGGATFGILYWLESRASAF